MSKDNLNKITDKELLAICNLSNLKMEFANLIFESVNNFVYLSSLDY